MAQIAKGVANVPIFWWFSSAQQSCFKSQFEKTQLGKSSIYNAGLKDRQGCPEDSPGLKDVGFSLKILTKDFNERKIDILHYKFNIFATKTKSRHLKKTSYKDISIYCSSRFQIYDI